MQMCQALVVLSVSTTDARSFPSPLAAVTPQMIFRFSRVFFFCLCPPLPFVTISVVAVFYSFFRSLIIIYILCWAKKKKIKWKDEYTARKTGSERTGERTNETERYLIYFSSNIEHTQCIETTGREKPMNIIIHTRGDGPLARLDAAVFKSIRKYDAHAWNTLCVPVLITSQ